jgi:RNA polymerase sigma-70 factor (ECF subfamily)
LDRTTITFLREHPAGHTQFLVTRARAGSNEAWRELLRRYGKMLEVQVRWQIPGFARRAFGEDDVIQSALVNALRNIDSFEYRSEGSFRRWLTALVVNELQNQIRAQRAELANVPIDPTSAEDQTPDESAKGEASRRLSQIELIEKLGKLDHEDREVISMRVLEGLSWIAIGEVLDGSKDLAQARYHRAIARLQRLLE